MTSTSSVPGKSLSTPSATPHSPAPSQSTTSSNFESTRRPSSQASGFGGQVHSAPRKREKQGRNQRRAAPGTGSSGTRYNLDDEDAMPVRSRRGGTSILLNYWQYLPSSHDYQSGSRSYRRSPGHYAVDKARYVHANYRFVVNPAGNYAVHAVEPDQHLDWADVLQVLASAESQQTSCPICLSEPVAPRMAKCGHIFCLPCLIRFMNSSSSNAGGGAGDGFATRAGAEKRQNRWRKCPICEDAVYIAEVRPVRFYAGQESPLPRPGDDVVMRLMMRNAKSTLALPKEGGGAEVLNSSSSPSGEPDIPWHFAANVMDYARIMKGTGDYMDEQFNREIEDLLKQEKEDELLFHEDGEWTQRAIKAIMAAMEKTKDQGQTELAAVLSAASKANQAGQARHSQQSDFHFYTSPPHLYLSPLDIRILKTKYGAFSAFPSTLLPRVEHINTGQVVDDAMRKRAKYLGHLPQGCLISFLECDWTDIVPVEILATFADEIERRRKTNRDKAAQEERERLQAERIEAAAIRGSTRRVAVPASPNSAESPPPATFLDDFLPLGASASGSAATPPNPRPGFAHLADISTSPSSTQRTVWGTPAVPGMSPETGPVRPRQEEVDDGWLTFQMEELGLDAEGTTSAGSGSGNATPGGTSGGGQGGKKKKKQKITLMSTGGRRGI